MFVAAFSFPTREREGFEFQEVLEDAQDGPFDLSVLCVPRGAAMLVESEVVELFLKRRVLPVAEVSAEARLQALRVVDKELRHTLFDDEADRVSLRL